jgi:hypothetical protein
MNEPDEQPAGADSENDPKQPEPTELAVDAAATGDDEQHSGALPRFVTKLAPLEEQVGVHVITALQHPKTFAVMTTVATDGGGGQQVVSIALDADRFGQIQKLLATAPREGKRRVRCVGFHCHFEDDDAVDDDESGSAVE